ncbi:monovalent cation:proton antiporter-2 (CPA2) family protein [Sinorhizobium meliloti]|jgi:CPA2 family monovalent cation:H+ antiporter-2|uniref:Probable glutathione-regulated potassium-efflux system transmembrane protein n=2 Tax=Rhizobium meliloti TaxID=382 RepID=Q92RQ3_RHIME|nr:monovalent cation:proton antiporter-2 (CPA2) family protein [Sinorhizobium meliloti]PST28481.1 potassium transporter TrkA [Mesorhizobium loti]TWA94159.1 Kef-type potassium/proton antiporter (CPA2 family) [Ensifer sp. SEMIA 134]TWB23033.1 Kef-type potassium/proton antiporter (CPA2 family) [Ensifer sp. SEMIA 135]AEG03362.1 potassium efflux system protein [Sinorhizobium meliloti BL225C]AGG73385.1 putative glutathione-regulated potassium-efflux system transmembrane protein [Sinorhizobium melilo
METTTIIYSQALMLLAGAVVAAPLFKRLGLGTILGYLAAGILIGPVAQQITEGEEILHVSELGVVFLLFIIGLELKPSRLWQMRRDIFGLGTAQVVITGAVLSFLIAFSGLLEGAGSIVAGFGLALSSTAFAMQILEENNDTNTRYGQRAFSILLLQDLAIVPLLAIIPLMAAQAPEDTTTPLEDFAIAIAAVAALFAAGRYLLNPLFQVIARTGARDVMIAAALLVVMGAATMMQLAGLSMAMGAFLAGVLLAESSYRHELEADIEPFRGILQALFFMAVGLSLELQVVAENLLSIIIAVPVLMLVKSLVLYGLCRATGSRHNDAVRIGLLLPQGGEFGFVLFTAAAAAGVFSQATSSLLVAIVTLSMALTPVAAMLSRRLMHKQDELAEEIEEDFEGAGAGADVLMIGFSRFAQIASQILLAGGRDVTIIDHSAARVRQAATFGFRIYFGDGTRLDVLRAAGIEKAKIVAVCTQKKEVTDKIIDLVHAEYPNARIFARSYDRLHTLELRARGVDYELRETFESGLLFGRKTLEALGVNGDEAIGIMDDIRRRDEARLVLQEAEGITAGRDMLHSRPVRPEPLVKPKREVTQPDDALADLADETLEKAE